MDIIGLYEVLKKYISDETRYDNLFYDAPEGEVQVDIVRDILKELLGTLQT